MNKKFIFLTFLTLLLMTFTFSFSHLMRFPDINGNKIVFVYAGDLYIVNSKGGTATRLTSYPGYEMFLRYYQGNVYNRLLVENTMDTGQCTS